MDDKLKKNKTIHILHLEHSSGSHLVEWSGGVTPAVRSNSGGGFCVIPLARNLGLEIVRVLFLCIFFRES